MTTLLGIIARKGNPGVVLASDIIGTGEFWDRQGDVSIRKQFQDTVTKISLDERKTLAVAMAGTYDDKFREFLYDLRHGKIEFQDAAKKGYFEQLLRLNLSRADGRIMKEVTSLLVASRTGSDEPELHSCWPLGRIDSVPFYTSIGSGSEYALSYLHHQLSNRIPREVSLAEAIKHARRAVAYAGKDIHTKGLDIAVITKDNISQYGDRIDKVTGMAANAEIKKIIRQYQ